jgi:hypothetical protein
MRKSKPLGLIATGKVSHELAVIAGFRDSLGPIQAVSLRVASKMANRLKAGHPVSDARAFEHCRTIFVDADLRRIPAGMNSFRGKNVIFFGAAPDDSTLRDLRSHSAAVATLLPGSNFALEGDLPAVREVKRMLRHSGRKFMEIKRGKRSLFEASLRMAATIFEPFAATVLECLRDAGLTARQARESLECELVRAVKRAGGHKRLRD